MKGSRRVAREIALQALYNADVSGTAPVSALDHLVSTMMDDADELGTTPDPGAIDFARAVVQGVSDNADTIDELIQSCSRNWKLPRMAAVDRNILRIAGYELSERKDIPGNVSVNEAVELAKKFGTEQSRAWVNGLVDQMGQRLGRLAARRR